MVRGDDLGSRSVDDATGRMLADVAHTAHIARPPSMRPPRFARSAAADSDDDEAEAALAVSARPATVTRGPYHPPAEPAAAYRPPPPPPPPPAPAAEAAGALGPPAPRADARTAAPPPTARDLYLLLERHEARLYYELAPHERARLRQATCPPHSHLQSLYANPETSALLLAVGCSLLCVLAMSSAPPAVHHHVAAYRAAASASLPALPALPQSCNAAIDRLADWFTPRR